MNREPIHEVTHAQRYARLGHVALAVTIGVSLTGFLHGVSDPPSSRRDSLSASAAAAAPGEAATQATAVDYDRMHETPRGPNAAWQSTLPAYDGDPAASYGIVAPSADQRGAALARRSDRRAYSGAPPVVPHPIDESNAQACLACHAEGLQVGDVIAPRMSHHVLANCTQCHVEADQDFPGRGDLATQVATNFVGLAEPGDGERIGPGAPPTIPHPVWMRSECLSCHGPLGAEGLRTSHPWRTNCTQCHAASREFDATPLNSLLKK